MWLPSTSPSKRTKVDKRCVGTLLKALEDKNNFLYLDSLPTVTERHIYVDRCRHKTKDPTVMRKDQFKTAITQSSHVQKSSVPLALIDIIADYGYVIPGLREELKKQLPLLPDRYLFEDDPTLIKIEKPLGVTAQDIMQRWIPQANAVLDGRRDIHDKMESTLNKVMHILLEKCWNVEIFYQTKKYDVLDIVSVLLAGVTRLRSENHVYIFRVYVSRVDGPIYTEMRIQKVLNEIESLKFRRELDYNYY